MSNEFTFTSTQRLVETAEDRDWDEMTEPDVSMERNGEYDEDHMPVVQANDLMRHCMPFSLFVLLHDP